MSSEILLILTDPAIILELLALLLSGFYLFLSLRTPETQTAESARRDLASDGVRFAKRVCTVIGVGELISLPKRSLQSQRRTLIWGSR